MRHDLSKTILLSQVQEHSKRACDKGRDEGDSQVQAVHKSTEKWSLMRTLSVEFLRALSLREPDRIRREWSMSDQWLQDD